MNRGQTLEPGRLSVGAVLTGWLIDVGGSTFAGLLLALALGVDPNDPDAANPVTGNIALEITTLAVGLSFLFTGAYVAARRAPANVTHHAFWVGVLSVATSFAFLVAATEMPPLWYTLVGFLASLPVAIGAGWLEERRRRGSR